MALEPGAAAPSVDMTGSPAEKAPEAVPAVEPKENPQEAEFKSRFAQLARREKSIMQQKRQLAEERAKIEQMRSQPQAPDESWKKHLAENPMDFLAQQGITYDKLTEQLLNSNPTDTTVRLMQQKLAAIEAENQQFKQQMTQNQEQSYAQAIKQMGNDVKNMIAASPEMESLSASGDEGVSAVVALIEETWKEDGYIMDIQDAAQQVEEYLTDQYLSFSKLKKIQAKLAPAAPQESAQTPLKGDSPTLSHSPKVPMAPSKLSEKERRERAIAVWAGRGKV